MRSIYLHASIEDEAALKLYASVGYHEVARDPLAAKFRGIQPKVLLAKES